MRLSLPDGTIIPVTQIIPERYRDFTLRRSINWYAVVEGGSMLFSHFKGEGYSIWKSRYEFSKPVTIRGAYDGSVLELCSMYEQSFSIDWKNLVNRKLSLKQMEMYFATGVDSVAYFPGGRPAVTIDVHFDPATLESYAGDFPLLRSFLEKVYARKSALLFDGSQYTSAAMDLLLQGIMRYDYLDGLAPLHYDSHVNLLLIKLFERISQFNPHARGYTQQDKDHAHDAFRLITDQKLKSNTIHKLCRQLGTSPYRLKTTFKHVFGMSIGKYHRKVLMDYALDLLQDGKHSIDDIALELDYCSQQSFTTAFRSHFGFTPGSVGRRGR